MINSLSIIIPVYNEENTITKILDKVIEVPLVNNILKEIIIINDASTDKSDEIILKYISENPTNNLYYFKQESNQGKGAALHKGIKEAKGEFLIIQDADLEYDPFDYNDMLKPILSGCADVVYGSRFMGSKPHRVLFFFHTIGNKLLTTLCNFFCNVNITDMETCYKMINTKIAQQLDLKEKRFGFEPEVTIKLSRIPKIRIYEVGIAYYGRTYEDGKKIGWKDGVRALYCIFKYGLFSR
ncbi:MAG TPA: glycosyltransferase family 2 protein [Chitinophagales bacterium]|nr:glycosyltransferase family 2 protein [Chitinophagales bacterium]